MTNYHPNEALIKSFDKLSATAEVQDVLNAANAGAVCRPCVALPPASMQSRTNGRGLIQFVVSLSNALLSKAEGREGNHLLQGFPNLRRKQNGFGIVMAMFILVVLGLLGVYMVRFAGVQTATSTYSLQGARAYQAAKAGLGWAVAKINAPGGTCVGVDAQTVTFPNLTGFSVALACTSTSYPEGSSTPVVFQLNATSEFGAYGSADYVHRRMEMSIVR